MYYTFTLLIYFLITFFFILLSLFLLIETKSGFWKRLIVGITICCILAFPMYFYPQNYLVYSNIELMGNPCIDT